MKWITSTVEANGIEVCVHRAGPSGAPVVVLVHGFSDDGRCWGALAERIVDRFDVVALDARNHGGSARGPADADVLADDLIGVCRNLDVRAPILVGHSIGASTVALAAARSPDLANRIVLEDPPWRLVRTDDAELAMRRDDAARWIMSLAHLDVDQLVDVGRRQHPAWSDEELIPWAMAKVALGPRAVDHLAPFDWRAVVPRIRCPALVVLGDPALDAIATPQLGDWVIQLNPNVTIGKVDGAGHNVRRERLTAYVDLVMSFLESS